MMNHTIDIANLRLTRPPDHLKPKTLLSRSVGDLHNATTGKAALDEGNINVGMPVVQTRQRRADPERRKREIEEQTQEHSSHGDGLLFGNISTDALKRLNAMIINFFMMKDGTISREINLSRYGIDCGTTITDSVVQELCTIQPHLTLLDLTNCVEVSDAGLWAIARHCKCLETLILAGCNKITDVGLRSIKITCKTITTLDFDHCTKLDDIALTVISTGTWILQKLSLRNCTKITDTGVGRLAKCMGRLKRLDLSGCSGVGEFGDHALKELGAFCSQLEEINLSGCRRVEDAGFRSIAVGCPKLQVFKASGCQLISKVSLVALARHNSSIHTLSLVGCESVYDTDFAAFHRALLTSTLTNLDISGCVNLTDKGVAVLIRALGVHVDTPEDAPQIDLNATEPPEPPEQALQESRPEDEEPDYVHNRPRSRYKKFAAPSDRWGPENYKSAKVRARELKAQRDKFIAEREAKAKREYEIAMRGCRLIRLTLVGCEKLTDFSATIIGTLCGRLRELNLSNCTLLTDETVHSLARKVTGLTTLKLDGIPRITARALISHTSTSSAAFISAGKNSANGVVEFADMAKQWVGYQPKPGFEKLMELKVEMKKKNACAQIIQCAIRRKFAYKIFKIRRKAWLIAHFVPKIQAAIRAYLERKRYRRVMRRLHRIRCAIRIQQCFRMHLAYKLRVTLVKEKRFLVFKDQIIVNIQRVYRGMKGRMRLADARNTFANKRLVLARKRARRELMAIRIQLNFRASRARMESKGRAAEKERLRLRRILEERMTRRLQRMMRGLFGRRKRDRRLLELALAKRKWSCAKEIQRIIRGHLGRKMYAQLLFQQLQELRRRSATEIQRQFRGYRGRVLGAVARAIHLLRKKQTEAAMLLQRVVRGHLGRLRAKIQKETVMRWQIEKRSSISIQRVFRGHKGREAAVIEKELQLIEHKVKPLLLLLETKETEEAKLAKIITRLEYTDGMLEEELVEIEKELDACILTTAKYTDSSRINYAPQRYLTKYLRVRLKDHLEHQREVFKVKHTELNKRRVEMRELEKHITAIRRELIPLTTGAVVEIKRRRTAGLRKKVEYRLTCLPDFLYLLPYFADQRQRQTHSSYAGIIPWSSRSVGSLRSMPRLLD
jgi:hypothetical protein